MRNADGEINGHSLYDTARHAFAADTAPLPADEEGRPLDPCERCGTPVEFVPDDPTSPPYFVEYHGELTPGVYIWYRHSGATCTYRRQHS